jgi:hypothetical protein
MDEPEGGSAMYNANVMTSGASTDNRGQAHPMSHPGDYDDLSKTAED